MYVCLAILKGISSTTGTSYTSAQSPEKNSVRLVKLSIIFQWKLLKNAEKNWKLRRLVLFCLTLTRVPHCHYSIRIILTVINISASFHHYSIRIILHCYNISASFHHYSICIILHCY